MSEEQEQTPRERFLSAVRRTAEEFVDAQPVGIPMHLKAVAFDRVMAAVKLAGDRNQDIWRCKPGSIARCVGLCALTGLSPGGPLPECDLIPRKRQRNINGNWQEWFELDWQMGWRGYQVLTGRTGAQADPIPVFEGDHFVWSEMPPMLEHAPSLDGVADWDTLLCCYTRVTNPDGTHRCKVIRKGDIEKRRALSEAWQHYLKVSEDPKAPEWKRKNAESAPWFKWPVEMAQKTALIYAARRGFLRFDELTTYALDQDSHLDIIEAEPAALPGPIEGGLDPADLDDYQAKGVAGLKEKVMARMEERERLRQPDPTRPSLPVTDDPVPTVAPAVVVPATLDDLRAEADKWEKSKPLARNKVLAAMGRARRPKNEAGLRLYIDQMEAWAPEPDEKAKQEASAKHVLLQNSAALLQKEVSAAAVEAVVKRLDLGVKAEIGMASYTIEELTAYVSALKAAKEISAALDAGGEPEPDLAGLAEQAREVSRREGMTSEMRENARSLSGIPQVSPLDANLSVAQLEDYIGFVVGFLQDLEED